MGEKAKRYLGVHLKDFCKNWDYFKTNIYSRWISLIGRTPRLAKSYPRKNQPFVIQQFTLQYPLILKFKTEEKNIFG